MRSARIFILFIPLFLFVASLQAGCPTGNITLSRQSEVDSFSINYSGCTQFFYQLTIDGNNILNLNGLNALELISSLVIKNTSLTHLYGLGSLSFAAMLTVENNPLLLDMDGLTNLDTIGNLSISNNNKLMNLKGLEPLKCLSSLGVVISNNSSLITLDGLNNLESVGIINVDGNNSLISIGDLESIDTLYSVDITNNASLQNIDGLNHVKFIRNELDIMDNNGLLEVDGFQMLNTIGGNGLHIKRNSALQHINGLNNLDSVHLAVEISYNANLLELQGLSQLKKVGFGLEVSENPLLRNLEGLKNLISVNQLTVYHNISLVTLNGLNQFVQIHVLGIWNNPVLKCCILAQKIIDNNPDVTTTIYSNDVGCNSVSEIMALNPTSNCCIPSYSDDTFQICQGQNIRVGIHNYYLTGMYKDTLPGNIGCDSIITTNLTVFPKYYQIQTRNLCTGQSFTLSNGRVITTTGIYNDTLPAQCDSIIEYHLNFLNNITTTQNAAICRGKLFTLPNGSSVNQSGIYRDTLVSSFGCDSIIVTNLTVDPYLQSSQSVYICHGGSYTLPGGSIVNQAGSYADTIKNSNGCDSIIVTNLIVDPYPQSTQSVSICPGSKFTLPGGRNVSQPGTYSDTIQNANGCDSIITTDISLLPYPTGEKFDSVCSGQSYTVPGGNIVNNSGDYTDTIKTAAGCDSILTIHLSVYPNTFTVSISPQTDTIIRGQSLQLNPEYVNGNPVAWSWTPNSGLSCDDCETPWATPTQTVFYIVTVTNNDRCTDTAGKQIVVTEPGIYIPNAFSPNGDGINDLFGIFSNGLIAVKISVYNRWGELVFETTDVNTGWNGYYKGAAAPVGDYTYIVIAGIPDGSTITKKGTITLLR